MILVFYIINDINRCFPFIPLVVLASFKMISYREQSNKEQSNKEQSNKEQSNKNNQIKNNQKISFDEKSCRF